MKTLWDVLADQFGRGIANDAMPLIRQWMDAEGLVCVPRESTMEMFAAADPVGMAAFHSGITVNPDRIWSAMLSAAPDVLGEK
jgi:hypothetical protein